MAKFKIYGDYGYQNETLLGEFDNVSDAIRQAKGYVEDGYDVIEVANFSADGEYLTHWCAS